MKKTIYLAAATLVIAAGASSVQADAKQDFVRYCAACHGADGKGTGPMITALKGKPSDLTQLSKANNGKFPYMKVRRIMDGRIDKGNARPHSSREMPIWGDVFEVESGATHTATRAANAYAKARILNIIDYLASIQK